MQKITPCILCSASNFRIIFKKDKWRYLRCMDCGLVSIYPKPTPTILKENYDSYLPVQKEKIEEWEMMMRPVVLKSADLIESETRGARGRLLDIGCGYGFFLREMRSRGWDVEGIEISGTGREYARDKWNIHVYPKPLEDLVLPGNSFDVITLFYVIEHVADPLDLLIRVKHLLRRNGLLLLRWPHSTPVVRFLGPLSGKLDLYHTPYHIYDFSPETIKKLLGQGGFRNIKTVIGGYTRPPSRLGHWASTAFGSMGEVLYFLSGGNILFPGISKTTLSFN